MNPSKRAALPAAFLIIALALFALTGCGKAPQADNPSLQSTRTAPTPPIAQTNGISGPPEIRDAGLIRSDVRKALEDNKQGIFPKGVTLNSAEIKAGVLSLDFDAAFNGVANLGESGESDAQKELIRIAAGYGAVKRMRVTVNGKSFQSQATDWNTPFSVRPSANDGSNAHASEVRR